jgi:hypothetical protein
VKDSTTNIDEIRERAHGHWPSIFDALGIEVGTGKHRPCPVCGGRDRFRFDDKSGSGSWYCNVCDPHAGDGFALVMNVRGCSFPEVLRLVAGVFCVAQSSHVPRLRSTLKPFPRDLRATAFQFELAAVDLRLRAERIIEAGKYVTIAVLTDEELDLALAYVTRAYADVKRAELFERVAVTLRQREYNERTHRERQERVA